jgi:polyisoprenoid-binding protein YceI
MSPARASTSRTGRFAFALALGLSLLARAPARADQTAGAVYDLQAGSLSYTLVHKLHEVKGTTQKIEGRALVKPDGTAKVQMRAPVASFDSGNSNRDTHMREVTNESRFPFVSLKATFPGIKLPLAAATEAKMEATVELNGQKQQITIPVRIAPDGDRLKATFAFPISLEAFKIERPSLLFTQCNDDVKIEGEAVFTAVKQGS